MKKGLANLEDKWRRLNLAENSGLVRYSLPPPSSPWTTSLDVGILWTSAHHAHVERLQRHRKEQER